MPARKLHDKGHILTLFAAVVYLGFSFMVWALVGALGAYIASSLDLRPLQKALMVAIPPLSGSVLRLVFGSISDRCGVRRTAVWGTVVTFAPLIWGWIGARSFGEVIAIGVLLGIPGASFAVAIPLVSQWFPADSQGIALGVTGAGNSGVALATFFAPRLAEAVGWHAVFGLAIFPMAVALALLAAIAKEPPQKAARSGTWMSVRLVADADARWLCAFYAVSFGGFVGLVAYLPIFLVDSFGTTKVTAGSLAAACALAGSLVRPLGGWIADRIGGTSVMAAAFGIAAMLALLLSAGIGQVPAVVSLAMALAGLGLCNGAVFQIVPQRFANEIGTASGLIGACGGLGGFVMPMVFGMSRVATGSYEGAFAVWAVLCAAATVAAIRCRRRWCESWNVEVAI